MGSVRKARALNKGLTYSQTVKGSRMHSASKAQAGQSIRTLISYQGIRKMFSQQGLTHSHPVEGSGRLELDRGTTHSQPAKESGTHSVKEAQARQRINTLTICQEMRDIFCQQGSSSTGGQHNSPTVKGSEMCLVS
jgi:hypothetical protein